MPHTNRQRILEELSRLDRFRRGQLSEQYYERVNAQGQKVRQGPYYVWQGWVRGQKRSVRIAPDQVAQVRADLQAFAHFKNLCTQLADLTEQSTVAAGGDAKKNAQEAEAALGHGVTVFLALAHTRLREHPANDLRWLEIGLREALRWKGQQLLGELLADPALQVANDQPHPGERRLAPQPRTVQTLFGPVDICRPQRCSVRYQPPGNSPRSADRCTHSFVWS